MATQPQIHANRLNAQKSTGPRTQEGKAAISQNALKHGLSARQDVIVTESQEEYDLHRDSLLEELTPQTPMEAMLAHRIISLSWRLKRADRIQNQTFNAIHEATNNNPLKNLPKSFGLNPHPDPSDPNPNLTLGRIALKDFANERVLDRLLMYERRIENSLHKTILELQRLTLIREMTPTNNPEPAPQQARSVIAGVSSDQNKTLAPPFSRRRHDDVKTIQHPESTPSTTVEPPLQTQPFPAKQTQSQKPEKQPNLLYHKGLHKKTSPTRPRKTNPIQTQSRDTQYDIERSEIPMHIGIRNPTSEITTCQKQISK